MPLGVGQWITPIAYMRNTEQVFAKLENFKPLVELDLNKEINYFNNPSTHDRSIAYDNFFAYTKTCPLYDQRKQRCNRKYLADVWANIHNQEKNKPVPACTSMNYGKRLKYDEPSGENNRRAHIANFYRRRDVVPPIEKSRYCEQIDFNI